LSHAVKLRTLVHAIAAICAALLLLLAVGLAFYYQDSRQAVVDGRVIDNLQAGINELRFVMVETILYEMPRSREQWRQKHASLLATLDRKSNHSPRERLLLGRIRANLVIACTLYQRLTDIAARSAGEHGGALGALAADSGSAKEARARTVSSMLLVTQEMLDDANELSRINQNTIIAAQKAGEKLILLTLLLVGVIVGWVWWLIRIRVLSPIAALQEGTASVAAGRLEHRLGLPGQDEIGSLARAFDAMTEQLQSSRDQLSASEALKASVLTHAAYAIVATDMQGIITVFNPGAEVLLGYRADELVGKQTPAIFHDPEEVRARAEALSQEMGIAIAPGSDVFTTKTCMTGIPDENEWTYIRKDGTRVPALLSITARTDAHGQLVGFLGISLDISERKANEAKIHDLAYYDSLTQLPNRRLLLDRLGIALPASARRNTYGAILFLDLDNFKVLNDTKGHEFGDLLLMEVARRLLSCVRMEDTVARQGGDEFIVLLEDLSPDVQHAVAQAEVIGEKIRAALGVVYLLQEHRHYCTCSIGISLFKGSDVQVGEILKRADMAMYQAKSAGRDTLRFFHAE